MRLNRLERGMPDGTCNAGKVFYSCQISGFRGCCSVDPCALPACPDADYSSTMVSVSKSTSRPTTRQTLAWIPNSVLSSTLATTTIQPTSIVVDIAITSSTPTYSQTQSQTQTSSSTSTSIPGSSPPPGVPNTPIIAGTVSGVVALSILSILLWFCLRRRKQKRETRNSIAQYGLPNKEFALDRSAPSESIRVGGDVFAPFGGRYDQPRLTSATPPPRNGRSTPKQAPTSSQEIQPAAATGYGSGNSDPTTPITDRPLSDPEKSTLTPPPVHEHPFFHPLPGQSAEIPTYHPGTPLHANLTPIAPQKSTMRSHPTYHISQLSAHPAFRASKPPSPPRESGFPRRTSEVRKYHSLSPIQSSPRHQDQNPNPNPTQQHQNQQAWRHSELSTITSNALTSPILGRSELEADVPSTYLTPATAAYNTSSDFDYTNKYTNRRSQMTPISRGNTDSSKYSIPIGLGVDSISASNANRHSTSGAGADPSPPLQYRNSETRHELDSPYNNAVLPSLSISTQMTGPVGPNLNSPRDGGHIMSWAGSYSSPSRQTHSDSRQGLGHGQGRGSGSDEKEIVSPMTPERWSGATAVQTQEPGGGAPPLSAESAGESACSGTGLSPEAGTGTWGSWSGR